MSPLLQLLRLELWTLVLQMNVRACLKSHSVRLISCVPVFVRQMMIAED